MAESGITSISLTADKPIDGNRVTAWLNIRFSILHLLAGILTMTALFSINLRVMGVPNIPLMNRPTVIDLFAWLNPLIAATGLPGRPTLRVLALLIIVLLIGALLARFLKTEFGLAMRATGANPRMARAQGIRTDMHVYVGVALSNGLVALAGALFAQYEGFANIQMGIGAVVTGIATLLVGETLLGRGSLGRWLAGAVVGTVVFRLIVAAAIRAGLSPNALKLVTAALVLAVLVLPRLGRRLGRVRLAEGVERGA